MNTGFDLKKIYLTGGGSVIFGGIELLQRYFNVDVDILDPFHKLDVDSSIDYRDLQTKRHLFASAVGMGLGMQKKGTVPVSINILPEFSYRKKYQKRLTKAFFMLSLFCAIFFVFYFYQSKRVEKKIEMNIQSGQKHLIKLKKKQEKIDKILKEMALIKKDFSFFSSLAEEKLSVFRQLLDIKKVTKNDCQYDLIQNGFSDKEIDLIRNFYDKDGSIQESIKIEKEEDYFSLDQRHWILRGSSFDSFQKIGLLMSGLESYPSVDRCEIEFAEELFRDNRIRIVFQLRIQRRISHDQIIV